LILEKANQIFQFEVEDKELVVNYLQGFSAPIILQLSRTDQQLAQLIKCEKDGFALWDLKQAYFISIIQACYHAKDIQVAISEDLLHGMRHWIQSVEMEPALLAELLKIPSFEECLSGLVDVDPPKLEGCRKQLEKILANKLQADFKDAYQKLNQNRQHETPGQRAFRLLCLNYLLLADQKTYINEVYDLFTCSLNMTETVETLRSIMEIDDADYRKQALQDFDKKWHHQEIVMDKWFLLQAFYRPLDDLKPLLKHPCFSWENPNKVRSLIGGFTNNPLHFHDKDGHGYQFLTECVLKLDKINPQVAARAVVPFTRWDWLDSSRQQKVFASLKQLLEHDLSPNVYEMVSQSLPKH
jgi:aminopeptidase N